MLQIELLSKLGLLFSSILHQRRKYNTPPLTLTTSNVTNNLSRFTYYTYFDFGLFPAELEVE